MKPYYFLLALQIVLAGIVVFLVFLRLTDSRPRVGESVRPAGLYYDLSVVERPGACVYIYSNATGVGMTAVPKAQLAGQGC
jgi:hypothetical protein